METIDSVYKENVYDVYDRLLNIKIDQVAPDEYLVISIKHLNAFIYTNHLEYNGIPTESRFVVDSDPIEYVTMILILTNEKLGLDVDGDVVQLLLYLEMIELVIRENNF